MKLLFTDRLLMALRHYRVCVTQEFVGFLFEVDKGTVSRDVQELGLFMAGVLRVPQRQVRIDTNDLGAVFVDATQQPVNRPRRRQRRCTEVGRPRVSGARPSSAQEEAEEGFVERRGAESQSPLGAGADRRARFGKMKIGWIAADRYRNPPRRHTATMKTVAGLDNRM